MNNTTSIEDGDKSESGESIFSNAVFFSFAFVSQVSNIVNAYVIYVVITRFSQYRQRKVVALLVAHLSAIFICHGITHLFNTSNAKQLIAINPSLCVPVAYLKGTLASASSVNFVAIIFERLQSFNNAQKRCQATTFVSIIWMIALIFNLPSCLMVQPNYKHRDIPFKNSTHASDDIGTCIPVKLYGSNYATALYEITKFFVFYICVAVYTFCAFVQIRSKVNFLRLFSIGRRSISKNQARQVKRIYFHFISFFLLWILEGFVVFVHRALLRINLHTAPKYATLSGSVGAILLLYNVLNPLISLLLLDPSITWIYQWVCCANYGSSEEESNEGKRSESRRLQEPGRDCVARQNVSELQTFHVTSAVVLDTHLQSSCKVVVEQLKNFEDREMCDGTADSYQNEIFV